jgi:hypothetical protein
VWSPGRAAVNVYSACLATACGAPRVRHGTSSSV